MNTLAHFLIPRSSNNHKAHILHSSSLMVLVLLFIGLQIFFQIAAPKTSRVLGYAANISPSEVERLTNIQRGNNGLNSLTDNPVLDAAAQKKGEDMLAKGYWAHVAPDGTQPWAFFVNAGYSYKYAGENLARDFSDAQSAVDAWMASPSHKENILSPNYKETGIGVVEGKLDGVDTTIIVQFFGTKLVDSVPIAPIAQNVIPTTKPSPTSLVQATPVPTLVPTSTPNVIVNEVNTPQPIRNSQSIVAGSMVTPFDLTRYLSLGLVGTLIVVVAVDGFIINRRRIFRISGHFPAHFAFLVMILILVILAKVGRII